MVKRIEKQILDLIIPLYKEYGVIRKVSEILNIGETTVSRYLKKNNIDIIKSVTKSEISYEQAMELFLKENISMSKFSKKYHISEKWFRLYLRDHGITIENKQNKTKFNENIFDSIDTEEKAYWLGFIFADGYISSSNYTFELSLKSSDVEHLNKFNIFMLHENNNVKIGKVKCLNTICERCRWGVRNKHLWETLNNYGCTPNKSLTLQFPDENIFKDKSLIRHFIRGYFDGDGCLSYHNKDHTQYCINFLGTYNFLNFIKLYFNSDNKIYQKDNIYNLTFTGSVKNSKLFFILHQLYSNATIYLTRKFERYLECCRLFE